MSMTIYRVLHFQSTTFHGLQ